jgi:hypothetical protein
MMQSRYSVATKSAVDQRRPQHHKASQSVDQELFVFILQLVRETRPRYAGQRYGPRQTVSIKEDITQAKLPVIWEQVRCS